MKIRKTLERIDSSVPEHYKIEHLSRYHFIKSHLKDKNKILDLGCGVGYGAQELCKVGHKIIAMDISLHAILQGVVNFSHPNLRFLVSNGEMLPFPDEQFNVIISCEVIEHLSENRQHSYLSEIKRVLIAGGSAFISTPNRMYTAGKANPFHLKEFNLKEYKSLLQQYFDTLFIYGQHCDISASRLYRGRVAYVTNKMKEILGIQFLFPHWVKRALEFCITGSTMSKVDFEHYKFIDQHIEKCKTFLSICTKKDSD